MAVEFYKVVYLILFLKFCEARDTEYLPSPWIEAIFPKGLRVTLPDADYLHFTFNGDLNKKMADLEQSRWSGESFSPINGLWKYKDREALLKLGDKIYYRISVDKDGQNLVKNGEHTVTDCSFEDW